MSPPPSGLAFELVATCGAARRGRLTTPHGTVETPAFMPVGTLGAVKGVTVDELQAAGATVMLANLYHLSLRPGIETLEPAPGTSGGYGSSIIHADYTHSLVGALVLAAVYGLVAAVPWGRRTGAVLAGVVFSHWVLDLVVHRADLPLLPGNAGGLPRLGFGLWQVPAASIVVELLIVVFDVVVVVFLVVFLLVVQVVVIGDLELDGRVVDDAKQGAALRAGELVADVDVRFVDVDIGITLRANGGHAKGSLRATSLPRIIYSRKLWRHPPRRARPC